MASRVLGFLALLFLLQAQASEAYRRPNPAAILRRGRNYNTLISLLQANNLVKPLDDLVRTSGVTLFAPTDRAFNSLPPGTLKNLTAQQQTTILLLHVVPKYYGIPRLFYVRNPVGTAASGQTLTISLRRFVPFVSSGVVTTPIRFPLYSKFPLSIFPIDKVLLPRV